MVSAYYQQIHQGEEQAAQADCNITAAQASLVWAYSADGESTHPIRSCTSGHLSTEIRDQSGRGQPGKMSIKLDLDALGTGRSLEEAEGAAQDRKIWKSLTCHAAGAEMHDAVWYM